MWSPTRFAHDHLPCSAATLAAKDSNKWPTSEVEIRQGEWTEAWHIVTQKRHQSCMQRKWCAGLNCLCSFEALCRANQIFWIIAISTKAWLGLSENPSAALNCKCSKHKSCHWKTQHFWKSWIFAGQKDFSPGESKKLITGIRSPCSPIGVLKSIPHRSPGA